MNRLLRIWFLPTKIFFKLFTYHPIEGNLESALKEPLSVVITTALSEKLFGSNHSVGRTMKMNNNKELVIKAVIEAPKANSCLSFSAMASVETRKIVLPNGGEFTEWGHCSYQTFILLKKGVSPDETAKKILALFPEPVQKNFPEAKLNPFTKLYFSAFNIFGNSYLHHGDKKKVMILVMVAALVLMIALINFINISSSQWIDKIRQTGVLKVIGASRSNILWNILFEAFFLFLMSLFIAIIMVGLTAPVIRNYTGIHFSQQLLYTPAFLLVSLIGTFALSLIFSLVPAMRISSSKAVENLKKAVVPGTSNSFSRGVLVTAQFVIAIVLIAFTVLVQKQVNFGSNNLGFNQKNIIVIKMTPQLDTKKEVLKKLLQEKPNVKQLSFTQYYPGKALDHWTNSQVIEGEKKQFNFDIFCADAAFFGMTGLQLTQGRFFSDDLTTDRNKLVVNETFLRENKHPIGTKIVIGFGPDAGLSEIIGVVKDFHYKSVNEPIGSLLIQNKSYASYCLVSLLTTDFKSLLRTVKEINAAASSLSPSFPVEISFFDQAIEKMYQSELQFQRTFFPVLPGCAIVILLYGDF